MTGTWRGYWPASVTPFAADGSVDYEAIDELCDLYQRLGVHGVLVNGSSGEWYAQTSDERNGVARRFIENLASIIPVVVCCTTFTARDTSALARGALAAGASGIAFSPPPYARPDERELLNFFEVAAAEIDGPVMIYNWPRGTGIDIPLHLMQEIAGIPNVKAIKDSTPDYGQHLQNLQTVRGVDFFAHYISRIGLGVLQEVGGSGSIDGGSLGAPFGVPFYEAYWRGDLEEARGWAVRYDSFLSDLVGPGFVGRYASQVPQIKAAMALLHQPGGVARAPMMAPTNEALEHLRVVLAHYDLTE